MFLIVVCIYYCFKSDNSKKNFLGFNIFSTSQTMLLLPAKASMIKMLATTHIKDETANVIGGEEDPIAVEGGSGEADE